MSARVLITGAGLGTPHTAGIAPAEATLAVLDVNLIGPCRVTAIHADSQAQGMSLVPVERSRTRP